MTAGRGFLCLELRHYVRIAGLGSQEVEEAFSMLVTMPIGVPAAGQGLDELLRHM